MQKTAFVFPGQGSQYVGMGKELAEEYPSAAAVLSTAGQALNLDLAELCFWGPEEKLMQTEITQPAILAVSMAIFELLKEKGFKPSYVAGHSLGEYSALAAAETFSLEEAVKVVAQRGKWMSEAVPLGQGTMAAVLGLSSDKVASICEMASNLGEVVPANFNSPGQIVISGDRKAVEKASRLAMKKGAKRVLPLAVSGPFHSGLMGEVGDKLSGLLDCVELKEPRYSFVANTTGEEISDTLKIKGVLVEQVRAPVLWQQSVEYLIREGVSLFVEVGPGRVLSRLIKKIDRSVQVLNVEDNKTFECICKVLEGVGTNA